MEHNKILMCREIISGLIFLKIPTENFSVLKNQKGGLENFYKFICKELGVTN